MRIRTIKPEFWKNEDIALLSPMARLLFIGLWGCADREGRLEDRPRRLKAEIFPYDDCDADPLLEELAEREFITRYEVAGRRYLAIRSWGRHAQVHHMELPSEHPAPSAEGAAPSKTKLNDRMRRRVFDRDRNRCVSCGATADLIIDAAGGSAALQTLCGKCKTAKESVENVAIMEQGDVVDASTTIDVEASTVDDGPSTVEFDATSGCTPKTRVQNPASVTQTPASVVPPEIREASSLRLKTNAETPTDARGEDLLRRSGSGSSSPAVTPNRARAPAARPWPEQALWLKRVIGEQSRNFEQPFLEQLEDYGWWEDLGRQLGGVDITLELVESIFGQISNKLREQPRAGPTVRGFRKWVRQWFVTEADILRRQAARQTRGNGRA